MSHNITGLEAWKDVPGWGGIYQVSSSGRVKSLERMVRRGDGLMRVQEKILNLSQQPGRYVHVVLQHDGRRSDVDLHVLVAQAFHGQRPTGLEVLHINGDKTDNRASNLRYGTSSENSLDTVAHGNHHLKKRTHCPQGHALNGANLVAADLARGHRKCRACNSARAYVFRHETFREHFQAVADGYYLEILARAA